MFKNCIIYSTNSGWNPTVSEIEAEILKRPFAPCGPTQEQSWGWVPPRGEAHGALVESIGGQRIAKFCIETKSVPAPVIGRHMDERIAKIEREEGRKPGRKELRDLLDEVVRELLPHAFPKLSAVWVWFDIANRRLVLDTSSQGRADEVVTALVQAFPGLELHQLNTNTAPQAAMTQWLTGTADDWPSGFAPGRHVELEGRDEMRSRVKFDRHNLDDEQMRLHISQGKLPTKLALDWDGRVSFVLTEGGSLRKIDYLDGVIESNYPEMSGGFDADVAIATGELSSLINDLVEALGGVLE